MEVQREWRGALLSLFFIRLWINRPVLKQPGYTFEAD